MLHVIDRSSAPPVAPAVVAQLEITSSGSVTAAAAAAAEGGADMPTGEVRGEGWKFRVIQVKCSCQELINCKCFTHNVRKGELFLIPHNEIKLLMKALEE